jgi:hypothetical protein
MVTNSLLDKPLLLLSQWLVEIRITISLVTLLLNNPSSNFSMEEKLPDNQ